MTNQFDPTTADIKLLLEKRDEFNLAIEDIQAGIKVVNDELMARLDAENVKGKIVGNKAITKVQSIRFGTSLDDARELGATKTEEKVDTTKLRKLHDSGVTIPDTNISEYVMVKELKTKAEEESA